MPQITITRRELYDLVWSKPLRDVATDLGISDVGLAKVCERHRVPRPEQGYWNKINAGKPTKKAIFVDVEDIHLNRVQISGALSQLPEEVRAHIGQERAKRKEMATASAPQLKTPPASEPLVQLHDSIALTVRTLRKAKPDALGTVKTSGANLCNVEVSAASVERSAAFLDALARALEAKGLSIKATDTGVQIKRDRDIGTFSLKEKTRRQKHEPTAQELEAEAKRERRKQQYWSGARHDVDTSSLFARSYPEFDTIHTGALIFEIEGYDRGMRRSWSDGKSQTVETLIDSIVTGIDSIFVLRRVEREKREERERIWNELCRRRDLARRRTERERQRLGYWRNVARTQREIDALRRWIEQNSTGIGTGTTANVRRMVDWASERLAKLEQSISVDAVDNVLSSRNLFPDVDDLVDPLGDPPKEPQYSWQI